MSDSYPGDGMTFPPFPNPSPDWSQDDPSHPGFVVIGLDDTPGPKAYYIHMEAKPGKEEQLMAFLQDIHDGIDKEPVPGPGSPCATRRRRSASSRRSRTPRAGTTTTMARAAKTSSPSSSKGLDTFRGVVEETWNSPPSPSTRVSPSTSTSTRPRWTK